MIYRLCRKCRKPIMNNNTYCSSCFEKVELAREEYKKKRNQKYNLSRDKKYKQFYNSADWKLLKAKKLQAEQYRCERDGCHKLATEVHHIIPIQTPEGWELRLDYDNLECLCVDCHNLRHNRFVRKKVKQ